MDDHDQIRAYASYNFPGRHLAVSDDGTGLGIIELGDTPGSGQRARAKFRIVAGIGDPTKVSIVHAPTGRFVRASPTSVTLADLSTFDDDAKAEATFDQVPGLVGEKGVSFLSLAHAHYYLRHYGYVLRLDRNAAEDQNFDADGTFVPVDVSEVSLVGHWRFTDPNGATELTGRWGPLELHGQAAVSEAGLRVQKGDWARVRPNADAEFGFKRMTLISWLVLHEVGDVTSAGSALTMNTLKGDDFDGIVLGELHPDLWQAGSGWFARTQASWERSKWTTPARHPVERAAGELVKVAVAYDETDTGDAEMTLYRNDVACVSYPKGKLRHWTSDDLMAVFGARFTMGEASAAGHLDATIVASEIHDECLTAEQIAARRYRKDIGLVAIQMSMLPDGKVFCYGSNATNDQMPQLNQQDGGDVVVVDPEDMAGKLVKVSELFSVDSFCGAALYTRNAGTPRLCVVGGNDYRDTRETTVLVDYESLAKNQNSAPAKLRHPRWYSSLVTLPDGRILSVGGSLPYYHNAFFTLGLAEWRNGGYQWKTFNNSGLSAMPEVFDGTTWTELVGAYSWEAFGRENNEWWYPRAFLASDGNVFGVSGDRIWVLEPHHDPNDVNVVINTTVDAPTDAPNRVPGAKNEGNVGPNYTTEPRSGPGRTRITGHLTGHFAGASCSSVLYAADRLAVFGGGQRGNEDTGQPGALSGAIESLTGQANTGVSLIDYNGGNPTVMLGNSMTFPRNWCTAVALPTGEIAVLGGTRTYNSYRAEDWVPEIEIWTPPTASAPGGSWRTEGRVARPRLYHSAAVLTTDGTILIGGGGVPPARNWPAGESDGTYAKNSVDVSDTPYRDVEIYRPAYLTDHNGEDKPRPVISCTATPPVGYGETLSLKCEGLLPGDDDQTCFVRLISMPSITHGHTNDQRVLVLDLRIDTDSQTVTVTLPADAKAAPPGCYLLFFVNSAGVPSKALKIDGRLLELTVSQQHSPHSA